MDVLLKAGWDWLDKPQHVPASLGEMYMIFLFIFLRILFIYLYFYSYYSTFQHFSVNLIQHY